MIAPDADIESLFHLASDVPEADREAWVRSQERWPESTRMAVLELLQAETSLGHLGRRIAGDVPAGESIGPYQVVAPLGSGGGGVVYLARRTDPPRRLAAVKVVRSADTELIGRLRSEQAALARVDHPGIASILECGDLPDGRIWFAMAYVPGVPITEYVISVGVPTAERVRLVAETCEAVMHAHSRAILHRDLKPSNLLIDAREERARPTIIDLGLAKALDGSDLDRGERTEVGRAVGTPEYMAPEQAGGGSPDVRMDVFSIGCVLGAVLTGRPPRRAEELRATGLPLAAAIERVPIDLPSRSQRARDDHQTGPARWRELDRIVQKATEADPSARYGSVREFREDLLAWLEFGTRSGSSRLSTAPGHRRRLAVTGIAILLLVAAVLASTLLVERFSDRTVGPIRTPDQPVPIGSEAPVELLDTPPVAIPTPPAPGGPPRSALERTIMSLVTRRLDPLVAQSESPSRFAARLASLVREAEANGERLEPSIHLHLAEAFLAAGRHKDATAAAMVAEALDEGSDRLTTAHASMVMAIASAALRDDNQFAFSRAEKALGIFRSVLAADSRELLDYELSAWGTLARRDPLVAVDALSRLWTVAKDTYGADDPLSIRIEQARAGAAAMTANEAISLAPNREAYRHSLEILGPRHPTTLRAAASLMLILGYTDRREEAFELFRSFEPDLLATLGPEHQLLINSRMNAASLLLDLDRFAEAIPLARTAHDAFCRKYDRGHVLAVNTEEILISALLADGQREECIDRIQYHLDGPDDPRDPNRKQRMRSLFARTLEGEAAGRSP